MTKALHRLALTALATALTLSGCECDEEIYTASNLMQVRGLEAQGNPFICTDAEGNDTSASNCVLDFGDAGINRDNLRYLIVGNAGQAGLQIYKAFVSAPDSPFFADLTLSGDVTNIESEGSPLLLVSGDGTQIGITFHPTVEAEEPLFLGEVHLITDASNPERELSPEECSEHGAPGPCGLTQVQIWGWPKDLGEVALSVTASVGGNINNAGICDFGRIGLGGSARCTVTLKNIGSAENGDPTAVIDRGVVALPPGDTSACGGGCGWGQRCDGAACVDGPFTAQEDGNASGDDRRSCAGSGECEAGQFCAPDAYDPSVGFCSAEAEPAGMVFTFADGDPGWDPASPLIIEPGAQVSFDIEFSPANLAKYTGGYLLKGNFANAEGLFFRGAVGIGHNAPVAHPEVQLVDGIAPTRTDPDTGHVLAAPLSTIMLTGENSTGVNGSRIVRWEWSISDNGGSVPEGSQVRLQDPQGEDTAVVYRTGNRDVEGLDSAGLYIAALRVQDEHGVWSGWATVTFEARPESSLHVELTWDHPSSDIDLHLIRGGERADYTSGNDCYYMNCKPRNGNPTLSWGGAGNMDDPVLDLDDVNGFGPENINIEEPEIGQEYLVGAYYYRADGAGRDRESEATIRVYLYGRLMFEEARILEDGSAFNGHWWEVATVAWPEGTITPVDDYYTSPPR